MTFYTVGTGTKMEKYDEFKTWKEEMRYFYLGSRPNPEPLEVDGRIRICIRKKRLLNKFLKAPAKVVVTKKI
jgi:hypothetical protein